MKTHFHYFSLQQIKNNKMEMLHFALVLAVSSRMAFGANMACQEVRYAYSAKGMNVYDVPLKPQTGKILILIQVIDFCFRT